MKCARNRLFPVVLISALGLWVSGCASGASSSSGPASGPTPAETASAAPERTSVSPTPTEPPTFRSQATLPSSPDPAQSGTTQAAPATTSSVAGSAMDQAPSGAAPPQSNVSPTDGFGYTVESYLDFIIGDMDKKWSGWFVSENLPKPWITIKKVEPGTTVASKCEANPVPADYNNAFYCPADRNGRSDGSLVLPVLTFQKMWTGDIFKRNTKDVGDFAAAIITAHEFGHHVQNAIYLEHNAAHPENPFPPLAHANANKELIADCFAGVWMASTYYDGLLQPGDYEEAVAGLEAIGDTVANNDPHGTPEQRKEALLAGYNGIQGQTQSGDPITCIATYWK